MMGRKQFSYPNLFNSLRLFQLLTLQIYKKNCKNYSRIYYLRALFSIVVHPSLYLWTHEGGIGNGILINCKRP